MPWRGIAQSSLNGQGLSVGQNKNYIARLDFSLWRPSLIVVHNTASPTLEQWKAYPAAKRIQNLVIYFRDQQHWSAGPHAFIADDFIWPFTPYNVKGTHSPSWNGIGIGLEMVGDYAKEDDDRGPGFKVKMNTVAVIAQLCAKLGLEPGACIRLHKEDPRTTHDCPGKDIQKEEIISLVEEYMGHAGEHGTGALPIDFELPKEKPEAPKQMKVSQKVGEEGLNLRENSSASSFIEQVLEVGQVVGLVKEAKNGKTSWSLVKGHKNGKGFEGWVASRYLEDVKATNTQENGNVGQAGKPSGAAGSPQTGAKQGGK